MIKKYLVIFGFYFIISLQSIALADDIIIDSAVTDQFLSGDNNLTISGDGAIFSSGIGKIALKGIDGNLNITINTNDPQGGIRNTHGGNAINFNGNSGGNFGTNNIGNINILLQSGIINTSLDNFSNLSDVNPDGLLPLSTVHLKVSEGDSVITLNAGTIISSDVEPEALQVAAIMAEKNSGSGPASLTINNSGTISTNSAFGAIALDKTDEATNDYTVTINNNGLIKSNASNGNAIFAGFVTVGVNNNLGGSIIGSIRLSANANSFVNNDGDKPLTLISLVRPPHFNQVVQMLQELA